MVIPAACLIDLYTAAELDGIVGLEISRITNRPDYPTVALIVASGAEVVVVVDAADGAVSVYRGLNEYLRRERESAGSDLDHIDIIITGHGTYPFRA